MQDDDSESSSSSDSEVEQVVKTNNADKFLSLEDDDSPILLRNYENEADNIDDEGFFSILLLTMQSLRFAVLEEGEGDDDFDDQNRPSSTPDTRVQQVSTADVKKENAVEVEKQKRKKKKKYDVHIQLYFDLF